MSKCKTFPLGHFQNPKYVVCLSRYEGEILLSRHQKRETWETQGGHIEKGETPLEAAKRELYEESGAMDFTLTPAFEYIWEGSGDAGVVFLADIKHLCAMPKSEIKEVALFVALPGHLTYPDITPTLFKVAHEQYGW